MVQKKVGVFSATALVLSWVGFLACQTHSRPTQGPKYDNVCMTFSVSQCQGLALNLQRCWVAEIYALKSRSSIWKSSATNRSLLLVVMKAGSDHCKLLRQAAGRGRRSSIEGISVDAAGHSVLALQTTDSTTVVFNFIHF